ncbi:MAG TPA: SRPBCC family protein [Acidimicrobiales bacterium]|nr:SRPBCC family protein [Acidimicrobiales bacterium]
MDGDVMQAERVIAAPPEAVFDLVADAARHPDIDGSGSVRQAKPGAPGRLALGSTFGMKMKMGIGYSMTSTVIEFEENRRIAWQSRPPGFMGKLGGGRIWRYELEPVDGGTRVTESWDISEDHHRSFLRRGKVGETTKKNMEATLARIAELTEKPQPDA